MLSLLRQTLAATSLALQRLLTQPALSLAALAGLSLAAGILLSVPLYTDATFFRLFREELLADRPAELAAKPVDYAPLTFTFELKGVGRDSPQWPDARAVDEYLSGAAQQLVGLPIRQSVRRFHTDAFQMYPAGSPYALTYAKLALLTPLESTIQLIAGRLPQSIDPQTGTPLEVLASEASAGEFGVQVGDLYTLRQDGQDTLVTIVGLWQPLNPRAPYWAALSTGWLLVPEATYTALAAYASDELFNSIWSFTADGAPLHAEGVAALEEHLQTIQSQAETLLPKTKLVASPLAALTRYQHNVPTYTYLLFTFSVPILGLVLAFNGLVAGLFVGQQHGEMAILRSRGASRLQVVWILLLQGILLAGVALVVGVFLGEWLAHAIGQTRSFLDFTGASRLRVGLTPTILGQGLVGLSVILLAQFLVPILSHAEATIVTYKLERARAVRAPWWQRYWLDALLLLPAAYGLYQLQQQSRAALAATAAAPDPLQNPLLLLTPALCIFAAGLFTLRLVPQLMGLASWLLRPTKSVGLLMAARYLARTPAFYSAPLILLVLTLGLSAFTASLAQTLNNQLHKQLYYQTGADLRLTETGTTFNENTPNPVWTFRPVDEHLGLPGVRAATRVGRYAATASVAAEMTFMGLDRLTFPNVAYWQRDFASQSLGALLNGLGADPAGVLVSNDLLSRAKLKIGDPLAFSVKLRAGQSTPFKATIVGAFDLFPSWYAESGPLIVGNLHALFAQAGGEYPYEVWLHTAPTTDPDEIIYGVRGYSALLDPLADLTRLNKNGLNTFVKDWTSAPRLITTQQRRPEWQGLFGLLSVGFVASAVLTVLGFLLYALFSFRRRFIEMGMLRAIGLSVGQMTSLLAAELAFLILLGIAVGTAFGVWASRLFVPYLQIGAAAQAKYPPFQIEIAWLSIFQIYFLFAALFLAALGVLIALLLRMKIFQAVKLGETS